MSLAVAIQMDPIETINIDADSTFVLALEAQARGHRLYHYLVEHLRLDGQRLQARARRLEVRREHGRHHSFGPFEVIDLAEMDVVLMRQDPPFDMGYITATHLLDHIHPKTLVVNDPSSVRNAPEKLFVTHFPDLMPPTLITRDRAAILEFRALHRDIIVKPLFGNGGAGVFRLTEQDENLTALLELYFGLSREPLIIQRYLPEVRQGDKRIILIDGEPAGAVLRVPADGDLCRDRAGAAPAGTDLRRHRRDRRLSDRNQRDLADRAAGDQPSRRGQAGSAAVGCDRAAAGAVGSGWARLARRRRTRGRTGQ